MEGGASFSGRVALVSGGSRGIGAALCRRLGIEGVTVAVAYRGSEEAAEAVVREIRRGGGRAGSFAADLEDPAQPAALASGVERALGPVELLVANAGIAEPADWRDVDAAAFDRTLAVNLRAPFLLAQAVLPGMLERGFGRILLMSSTAAFTGSIIGPDYTSSKAALVGLTHYFAGRVAKDGVTVNAIAPGLVETEMLPGPPDELAQRVPLGRVGRPEEIADLAVATLGNG